MNKVDRFIDDTTERVAQLETLRPIALCECPYCLTNPPGPCEADAQLLGGTDDGMRALCVRCAEKHCRCWGRLIDGITDKELAEEYGRSR